MNPSGAATSYSGGSPSSSSASSWGTPAQGAGSPYGAGSAGGNAAGTSAQFAAAPAPTSAATAASSQSLHVTPITFLSLGLGLICSLLFGPFVAIVQTQVVAKLMGQLPDGYTMTAMTPGRGALFSFVVFCTFIALYLSTKYVRVLTAGDRFQSGICYIVMTGVATFLLSRIGGMDNAVSNAVGTSGLTLTGGLLPWQAMMSALVPAAVLFVGALLLNVADNVPDTARVKRVAVYVLGAIVMIGASGVIALSAIG
ncbi:hypothetical protein [Bifidobacterium tissieri]|uniref:hypothetical protein n=1 Tax=Bifidobacterium tissieri TaxID=1630162 RepID=UPI000B9B76AF|nr:hypothetical protein [Bifidobacterium tissieri]